MLKPSSYKRIEDIEALQQKLSEATEQYLRSRGWHHTCQTPGSLWLWEKYLDGFMYRVPSDLALSMQSNVDMLEHWDIHRRSKENGG